MKLKELLKDFDWCYYDSSAPTQHEYNTRTVRVYGHPNSNEDLSYFEIGRSTTPFQGEYPLNDFLRTDILDAEVCRYFYDNYLGILCVYLMGVL